MFNAFTPVQVTNEKLARHGEAGHVIGDDADAPGRVLVCFDMDDATESLDPADLKALA